MTTISINSPKSPDVWATPESTWDPKKDKSVLSLIVSYFNNTILLKYSSEYFWLFSILSPNESRENSENNIIMDAASVLTVAVIKPPVEKATNLNMKYINNINTAVVLTDKTTAVITKNISEIDALLFSMTSIKKLNTIKKTEVVPRLDVNPTGRS